MDLLQFLLEVLGVVIPTVLMWMVTQLYPLAPLPLLQSIVPQKEQQKYVFLAIPMMVYMTARLYFGMVYFVSEKLPQKAAVGK